MNHEQNSNSLHQKNENKNPQKIEDSYTEYDKGTILHSFRAPEYIAQERGSIWFFAMGIAVLIGVIIGIVQGSLSLVLVSVALGAVYTLSNGKQPRTFSAVLTTLGVEWKNQFILYQHIETFWIVWGEGKNKSLHLKLTNGFIREINIPLYTQKASTIRDILGYYIPETENIDEGLTRVLSRKLKL